MSVLVKGNVHIIEIDHSGKFQQSLLAQLIPLPSNSDKVNKGHPGKANIARTGLNGKLIIHGSKSASASLPCRTVKWAVSIIPTLQKCNLFKIMIGFCLLQIFSVDFVFLLGWIRVSVSEQ